jgi:serine/threonine protein kinase
MKAVGKLAHPNIVAAHDAGEFEGTHFLVMELIDGIDLSSLLRRIGPLGVADACELIRQAAVGLAHAHENGLVHRDIKPSNLMLSVPVASQGTGAGSDSGQLVVKILDLGLARLGEDRAEANELTTSGQMMGTLDYMAPEQGRDTHRVDIRADIYSLGATMFKLLCGEAPFSGAKYNTPVKMMMALATEGAPSIATKREGLPIELVGIVDRMLAKDPDDRFATPQDVAEALVVFADGSDLSALLERARAADVERVPDQSAVRTQDHLASGSRETAPLIEHHPKQGNAADAATLDSVGEVEVSATLANQ